MPHGLEVYNDSYTLQLYDRKPLLVFKSKGTHSTTTNPSPAPLGSRSRLDIPNVTQSCLVALRPQGMASFCVFQHVYSGTTMSLHLFCDTTGTQQVDWYAFDVPSASGQNYGLEVYDASGNLTYQSFAYPMNVTSITVANTSILDTDILTIADGGRTIAVIQGCLAGYRWWAPGADGDINKYWQQAYWSAVRLGTGSLVIGNRLMDRDTGTIVTTPGPSTLYNPRNYMVVDVTGL